MREKVDDILAATKLSELLKNQEESKKTKSRLLWVLAIIGAVAAVAGIALLVYRYLTPGFSDVYDDDDFDDDFEDADLDEPLTHEDSKKETDDSDL